MIESIVSKIQTKIQNFRVRLYQFFRFRADATMDLIDAVAGSSRDSVVKTSLSSLFRRQYSSITDVVDNLFRRKAEEDLHEQELQEEHCKISQLLAEQCPPPWKTRFHFTGD